MWPVSTTNAILPTNSVFMLEYFSQYCSEYFMLSIYNKCHRISFLIILSYLFTDKSWVSFVSWYWLECLCCIIFRNILSIECEVENALNECKVLYTWFESSRITNLVRRVDLSTDIREVTGSNPVSVIPVKIGRLVLVTGMFSLFLPV